MAAVQWDNLIIDRRAVPKALSDQQFREWMTGRPIFISSVMDDEMNPARAALRGWIYEWGGEPVMWEEITPRDQSAQNAYLTGVERSDVFVLLLGSRYGIADSTGYSPTHKEANRAKERGITRLLFEPAGLAASSRAGMANDWLRSLYSEVSAGKYFDTDDLVGQLERRLREFASAQETPWIRLGSILVSGTVGRRSSQSGTQFFVKSTVREPAVRHKLSELSAWRSRVQMDRLTWGTETYPVEMSESEVQTSITSEGEVTLICRLATNRADSPMHVGLNDANGRSVGAAEQAAIWARRALFGEESRPRDAADLLHSFTAPDGLTLPQVLSKHQAQGWLAEGLVRLYLIEGLIAKYGGHFEHLDVSPSTAASVRVEALFRLNDFGSSPVEIVGSVPLR